MIDSPPSDEYNAGDTPSISQGNVTLPPWENWYNDPDRDNSAASPSRTSYLLVVAALHVFGNIVFANIR